VTEPLPTLDEFHCFACAPGHPKGLRLRFRESGPDGVACEVTLGADYQGIDGIVHGGIVATMLDEAMAWCLYRHRRRVYVTATMRQRYREPVPVDTPLTVEARIEPGGSIRRVRLDARIRTGDGRALADGSGLFVTAPGSVLDAMTSAQRAALEGMFEAFAARDHTG